MAKSVMLPHTDTAGVEGSKQYRVVILCLVESMIYSL